MEETTRSGLRQHCLQAHQRYETANREREEREEREAIEARRRFVARELAPWLGSEPAIDALPFALDGLTFDVRYHSWGGGCGSERRLVLLWECPDCHEQTAVVWLGTDYQLGAFLADPKPDPCPGCKAEAEEYHRQQSAPPAPPLSVEERLTAAIRDLVEAKREERDEAESTRDYYRSEREERAQKRQEEELRRVEEQHRTDTYRLEDDLRRTQDALKRQQRGW